MNEVSNHATVFRTFLWFYISKHLYLAFVLVRW